jgi:hypothetical protein
MFNAAKPGRLGDFPDIDSMQGIAASERARAVLGDQVLGCFDIRPIEGDGYGIERHGTWEYPAESEIPEGAWESQQYWFFHPSRSFQGGGTPELIKPHKWRDPATLEVDPLVLEQALAKYRAEYKGLLHEVLRALAGAKPPPLFVARDSGLICFTEEFLHICKKARLVGMHTCEINNDDATQI